LEDKLQKLGNERKQILKEIRKIKGIKVQFNEEIQIEDTYTRSNIPKHEFEEIIEIVGEEKGNRL